MDSPPTDEETDRRVDADGHDDEHPAVDIDPDDDTDEIPVVARSGPDASGPDASGDAASGHDASGEAATAKDTARVAGGAVAAGPHAAAGQEHEMNTQERIDLEGVGAAHDDDSVPEFDTPSDDPSTADDPSAAAPVGTDTDMADGDGHVSADPVPTVHAPPSVDLRPVDDAALAGVDPAALEEDLDEAPPYAGAPDDGDVADPPASPPPTPAPASNRTADDLTSGAVLRDRPRPPESGWRRFVYEVTGGLIHPGASTSQHERTEQLAAVRTLVTQPRRITVLSRKGGVGKTTTALMLGQTLASQRGDRIVAVDGNPDAGSLGYRASPERPELTITDLLNDLGQISRYADVRRFTTQTPSGLEVLASDDDPHISTAMGEREYTAVLSVLDRFYNLVLIDTGTGILDGAVQSILDGSDQIVLVVAPSLDAARAASQTLDWLTEHGFVELVETAVTVINQTRRSGIVDVARIEEHFWDRCGAVVRIPWDRYLEAGAETGLSDLRPATRDAYLRLAVAVAQRFEPAP